MATQIAPKTEMTEKKEVPSAPGGPLSPRGELPFFLCRLREEFNHLLDCLSRGWESLYKGDGWRWGLEVRDEDDAVVVEAEAPGFEAGDFDVQVSGNRLVLRACKKVETRDEKGTTRESREQKCIESITLPPGIDRDKAEARYHNGVLTITVPKTAEGRAKKIAVTST